MYTLKTPSLRRATGSTSTKVTSNVLTHIVYVSLIMITSLKSSNSSVSLSYKQFAVMWFPEIDCYRQDIDTTSGITLLPMLHLVD